MKILLVGDNSTSMCTMETELAKRGHEVLLGTVGVDIIDILSTVDACVLDLRRGELYGKKVIDRARAAGIEKPILCLTAHEAHAESAPRAANQNVWKEFDVGEFLSKLDALMRQRLPRTRLGDLELDLAARRARVGEREIPLSGTEFALLAYFVQHAGETLTRPTVLKNVFGYNFDPGTNIVDVHVAHLRSKLAHAEALRITTIRGLGYRLEDI